MMLPYSFWQQYPQRDRPIGENQWEQERVFWSSRCDARYILWEPHDHTLL